MKIWLFLINPFLTAADKSYAIALKISTYHDAQLLANNADAFFAGLYATYHPLHLALATAYSNWKSQGGTQKGSTLTVNELLALLLKSKLNAWEYAIMGVYQKGTPGYVALFPRGRAAFNRGTKESRIAAVKQLGIGLTGIAALATTKTDVDAFFAELTANRGKQLGNKGTTENKSDALDAVIKTAMIDMFANYGLMINRFKNDPSDIEPYFDLDSMRNQEQLIFLRTVAANSDKNIMKRTFAATDMIKITNDGTVSLDFYLTNTAKGDVVTEKVTVEPDVAETYLITQLGSIENTFLNVMNPNDNRGHCKVEIL